MIELGTILTQTLAKPTSTPLTSGLLQHACARGQHPARSGGESHECKEKHHGMLQRAAVNSSPTHEVPAIVHEVLRSPGQPLDIATRNFMEPRFATDFSGVRVHMHKNLPIPGRLAIGAPDDASEQDAEVTAKHVMSDTNTSSGRGYDFSNVRVHTNERAGESARALGALAYTVGNNIVFDAGRFAPRTSEGRSLLAHELTHVVQQGGGPVQGKLVLGETGDLYEQEADRVAREVVGVLDGSAASQSQSMSLV